jgi:hypothetical protein
VGEAIARVARVKLRFGVESDAAKFAEDLVRQLEQTLYYAKDGKDAPEWERLAWKRLDKAYAKHREFNGAAFAMIRSEAR